MNTDLFGKTCVGIARVSTYVQDTTAQAETLKNMAQSMGLNLLEIFETKESGYISLDKKDGFGKLQAYLKLHDCKIVIVTELSRLARRKIILEYIKQWFLDNQIQLYVDNIHFSLFDDSGNASSISDIVFSIYATLAENEMKDKKVRFAQAHRDLNSQGLSIVGKVLFGYKRVKNAVKMRGRWRSKMEVDEAAAEQVRQVFDWYLNGINGDMTQASISKIRDECVARGFPKFFHSKRNVNKTLKCAFYTGELVTTQYRRKSTEYWTYKEEDAPKYVESEPGTVKYPPIISKELFDAVQDKMTLANTKLREDGNGGFADLSREHFTLLAKLVKCNCGRGMVGDYRKGRGHTGHGLVIKTYRCSNHAKHDSVTLPMRLLDYAVWTICKNNQEKYYEHLRSFPFQSSVDELKQRIANLGVELAEIDLKKKELVNRYFKVRKMQILSEDIFTQEMEALQNDASRIEQQINKERSQLRQLSDANAEMTEYAKHLHTIEGDKYNMRKYIQRMVQEIRPFFRDHYYTVTEIIMRDPTLAVRTSDPDDVARDLPDKVYLIMNTQSNQKPKISYISGPCLFDSEKKVFQLPNSDEATLENVFNDEEEVHFHSLSFISLNIDDKI